MFNCILQTHPSRRCSLQRSLVTEGAACRGHWFKKAQPAEVTGHSRVLLYIWSLYFSDTSQQKVQPADVASYSGVFTAILGTPIVISTFLILLLLHDRLHKRPLTEGSNIVVKGPGDKSKYPIYNKVNTKKQLKLSNIYTNKSACSSIVNIYFIIYVSAYYTTFTAVSFKMLFVTKPDIFCIPCKLRVCKFPKNSMDVNYMCFNN